MITFTIGNFYLYIVCLNFFPLSSLPFSRLPCIKLCFYCIPPMFYCFIPSLSSPLAFLLFPSSFECFLPTFFYHPFWSLFIFPVSHTRETIWFLNMYVWFISHKIIFSSCTHLSKNGLSLFYSFLVGMWNLQWGEYSWSSSGRWKTSPQRYFLQFSEHCIDVSEFICNHCINKPGINVGSSM